MARDPVTPHGTVRRGWRGCACSACRAAVASYARARRHGLRRRQVVLAAPVRTKIRQLLESGVGYRRIGALAAVSPRRVQDIARGRARTIQAATAARIVGVTAEKALGALVSSYRTKQLLDALRAEGYTRRHVAAALGIKLLRVGATVRVLTAKRIEALYEDWIGEPEVRD